MSSCKTGCAAGSAHSGGAHRPCHSLSIVVPLRAIAAAAAATRCVDGTRGGAGVPAAETRCRRCHRAAAALALPASGSHESENWWSWSGAGAVATPAAATWPPGTPPHNSGSSACCVTLSAMDSCCGAADSEKWGGSAGGDVAVHARWSAAAGAAAATARVPWPITLYAGPGPCPGAGCSCMPGHGCCCRSGGCGWSCVGGVTGKAGVPGGSWVRSTPKVATRPARRGTWRWRVCGNVHNASPSWAAGSRAAGEKSARG